MVFKAEKAKIAEDEITAMEVRGVCYAGRGKREGVGSGGGGACVQKDRSFEHGWKRQERMLRSSLQLERIQAAADRPGPPTPGDPSYR